MRNISLFATAVLFLLSVQSCKYKTEKELTFLTFNVWQEGSSVSNGLNKIHDVIVETNPDIVCFVEVRNYNNQDWTSKIVNALAKRGIKYYRGYAGGDVSFISKYPLENGKLIFENSGKGSVVNFNVNIDGKLILVSGAHLDYTYYASNLPRGYNGGSPNWKIIDDGNGKPAPNTDLAKVQAYGLKSTRDEAIAAFLNSIKQVQEPVILMGDFNEPSFLDWTENTKNMFSHNGLSIPWHNTKRLNEEGFTDAFRAFYPDETANPGFTWPSSADGIETTSWSPLTDERDRVDYIFFKGGDIKIKDVALVGPKESFVFNQAVSLDTGNEKFLADKLPWPSDHKAVYARLLFSFVK